MDVKITAIRRTCYQDLMEKYENPIEHACETCIGQEFISRDGARPEGLCESAWGCMREFVEELARGGGNFYDGWMKDPHSAMISCNDGFRPVSFYIETIDIEAIGIEAIDASGPDVPSCHPDRSEESTIPAPDAQ